MKPTGANASGPVVCGDSGSLLPTELFGDLDRHFAALLERLHGSASPEVQLAAALASRQRRLGHVCAHLPSFAGRALREPVSDRSVPLPPLEAWLRSLRDSPVVGRPGDFKPLVLDDAQRLYLQRYWNYEQTLAQDILRRAAQTAACDERRLPAILDRYFPAANPTAPDAQRAAAETAARRSLCVITGGPGTGKTHTLVRILATLIELAEETPPRFALAAPTGKAAARIQEEIRRALAQLPLSEGVRNRLPKEAGTLHRLLGARPDAATFRHHAGNPLPADVVVVDEASMVDLALMAKLFDATPPQARVILLGDKDQLASVEAGAILGDLCAGLEVGAGNPPATAGQTSRRSAPESRSTNSTLRSCLVRLRRNFRFPESSPLHQLSTAINDGDADAALAALAHAESGICPRPLPAPVELKDALRPHLLAAWDGLLQLPVAEALARLARFRLLCAVREGPYGVRRLNELAEEILAEAGAIEPDTLNYAGRPILITRNDHALRLFNGDVGLLLPHPEDGLLRAWFPAVDGTVREFPPARLPEHETVHAMTVHKSQGSEFASLLLILPERDSPVLTRELLYTGLTRARERAEVWFQESIFRLALARRVERHSGLRDALWSQAR